MELGVGFRVLPGLRFGVGLHTAFGLQGNANVFMNLKANSVSTMTFDASLKTMFSGYFGLLWSPGAEEGVGQHPLNFGLVYRAAAVSSLSLPMTATASLLEGNLSPDFIFSAASALYYDPATLESGMSFKVADHRWVAQVDYQLWSGFKPSALSLTQSSQAVGPNREIMPIQPGIVPSYQYVNTVVPRVGWEWALSSSHTLRLGYSYRPSILRVVSNGVGNDLDPPKHSISAGWGLHFDSFLGFPVPSRVDVALNYQQLTAQTIVKTPGDETGDLTKRKIGAPGYNAGGRIFGGAVSLALAF